MERRDNGYSQSADYRNYFPISRASYLLSDDWWSELLLNCQIWWQRCQIWWQTGKASKWCLPRLTALIKVINMLATIKAFAHKSRWTEYDWIIAQYTATQQTQCMCTSCIYLLMFYKGSFMSRHSSWKCYLRELSALLRVRVSHISFVDSTTNWWPLGH